MNQEKNWIHEMGPEEERKINDLQVEKGISDMSTTEPLEMIKKIGVETAIFKRNNPELQKMIDKMHLENNKEKESQLIELQNKWEELYSLKEEVDSNLEKYFGEKIGENTKPSFKNEKDENNYNELKREQSLLERDMKKIEFQIQEIIDNKLN